MRAKLNGLKSEDIGKKRRMAKNNLRRTDMQNKMMLRRKTHP